MTKADLITIITDKLKFPWARAELLVDVVFGCMEQSMSRGEKSEIRATYPNYPYTQEIASRHFGVIVHNEPGRHSSAPAGQVDVMYPLG
jgi:Bacterial nucleoid DNA-binding protein